MHSLWMLNSKERIIWNSELESIRKFPFKCNWNLRKIRYLYLRCHIFFIDWNFYFSQFAFSNDVEYYLEKLDIKAHYEKRKIKNDIHMKFWVNADLMFQFWFYKMKYLYFRIFRFFLKLYPLNLLFPEIILLFPTKFIVM